MVAKKLDVHSGSALGAGMRVELGERAKCVTAAPGCYLAGEGACSSYPPLPSDSPPQPI
jgi:hypothetical protein